MRIALILAFTACITINASAEIPWLSDLKTAHQKAQAENKLLLVHFESDNCHWCDRLEEGAFQSSDVSAAISGQFVPVKINASDNPQMAEYFKVSRFPTDVVVDPTGAVHSHSVSPQVPKEYVSMLMLASNKSGRAADVSKMQIATNTQTAQPPSPGVNAAPQITVPNVNVPNVNVPSVNVSVPTANNLAVNTQQNNFAVPSDLTAQPNANQFQLPSMSPVGVPTQTVSAPSIQQNLGAPVNAAVNNLAGQGTPAITSPIAPAPPLPEVAMDGFCAVSILENTKWVSGNKQYGAIHLGKLYLFDSAEHQAKFLANPEQYTPALGGLDVVRFIDGREEVEGIREYGVAHRGRLFFFSSEDSLKRFFQSPDQYSVPAQQIMRQAMARATDTKLR